MARLIIAIVLLILTALNCLAKDITVMVMDTGVSGHEMLDNHVKRGPSSDYVDSVGHGTHVAGIILYGNRINKVGIQDRVCNEVKIISCKVFGAPFSAVLNCINKAIEMKIDYINMSGGGKELILSEYMGYKQYVKGGGIVVAAVGNNGEDLAKHPYFPASYGLSDTKFGYVKVPKLDNVIAVANGKNGVASDNSSYHKKAVLFNGHNVYSTYPGDRMAVLTGSSMAAPAVLHEMLLKYCNQKEKQ